MSWCGRYESFQTGLSITRSLKTAGFRNIKTDRSRFFVVTAERMAEDLVGSSVDQKRGNDFDQSQDTDVQQPGLHTQGGSTK
jgi:hypothetical protein